MTKIIQICDNKFAAKRLDIRSFFVILEVIDTNNEITLSDSVCIQ